MQSNAQLAVSEVDAALISLAAEKGSIVNMARLLTLGADVRVRHPLSGRTPLHFAAGAGIEENVQWLLDHGAVWNQIDHYRVTAADLALKDRHLACYKMIVEVAAQTGEYSPVLVSFAYLLVYLYLYIPEYEWWNNENRVDWHPSPHVVYTVRDQALPPAYGSNLRFLSQTITFRNPRPEVPGDFAMVTNDGFGVMMEWERPLSERKIFDDDDPR